MRLVAILAVGVLGAAVLAGCATTASDARLQVLGYVHDRAESKAFIQADADAMDRVGIDGVTLTEDGHGVNRVPEHGGALVASAHAKGLKADLLLSNYSDAAGDFDPRIATRMLNTAGNRHAVIESLKTIVDDGGYDGLQLDLESMSQNDADNFVTFAQELKAALGPEKRLSTTVMASVTSEGYLGDGYDLVALDQSLDGFTLMAYDQHGPTFSDPGPIGGLTWVEACIDALLDAGLRADEVDLGIAAYGYRWPDDASGRPALSGEEARTLAGDKAVFDETEGEWTARLDDGTVIWWSDTRSIALRTDIARERGMHGTAIWNLELADPLAPLTK